MKPEVNPETSPIELSPELVEFLAKILRGEFKQKPKQGGDQKLPNEGKIRPEDFRLNKIK